MSSQDTASARAADAAPSAVDCAWQNIGTNAPELFHSASAFDTDNNVMYLYGGAGKDYSVENTFTAADMSAATLRAQWASKTASAARSFVGAAGAYRAKGKDSDLSAAYFFGGMSDPLGDGSSERDVQRWLVKAGQWERRMVSNARDLEARGASLRVLEDEDHGSTPYAALPAVLRFAAPYRG